MPTYKQLQVQIAQMKKEADEARRKETKDAVEEIKRIMAEYSLTIKDLEPPSEKKKRTKFGRSNVQFRDEFGNTWSGRGRTPAWLKGKNKELFRVV